MKNNLKYKQLEVAGAELDRLIDRLVDKLYTDIWSGIADGPGANEVKSKLRQSIIDALNDHADD